MPRGPRLDAPGTLHHVILRGIERRRIVNDDNDRDNFVVRMGTVAMQTKTSIYAYKSLGTLLTKHTNHNN